MYSLFPGFRFLSFFTLLSKQPMVLKDLFFFFFLVCLSVLYPLFLLHLLHSIDGFSSDLDFFLVSL